MGKILSIIDFDGMLYHSTRDTLEESIEALKDKLQNCLDKTNCTHWTGFVGKGKTFRNSISPDYKANRTSKPPKYLSTLKEWAIAEYNLNVCIGYEADDAVSYFYHLPEFARVEGHSEIVCVPDKILNINTKKILCTPDKDLLKDIAGTHFNYSYKLEIKDAPESIIKGWWVTTNKEDADNFSKMQMIVGDASDGIKGLPGKGIKYWEKAVENEDFDCWCNLMGHYIRHYQNIPTAVYEFQKNFRLLHILQTSEDFIREVGKVPDYPNITEVVKEEVVEIKDTF